MIDGTAPSTGERTDEEVLDIVRAVIRELAPNPEGAVEPESRLIEDLGFHSLALLELAFTLEDEFDLDPIDEETGRSIILVGDVERLVLRKIADRAEA
jgi:acyl carrier protein